MSVIDIHPRIQQRHPEIGSEDVIAAMRGMIRYQQRKTGEWLAVGFDEKNRFIELVYLYNSEVDGFFVYHAQTPPTSRTLNELELERKA
jgi:hypothetical protein